MSYNSSTSTGHPGSPITFLFSQVPDYEEGKDYYAVFFHGINNVTVPLDKTTGMSTVPATFESGKGIVIAVISDTVGAPTLDSVVAGPLILLQQPQSLTSIAGTAREKGRDL